jgi:hypothetical protein
MSSYIIIKSSLVHSFSCFDGHLLLEIGGPCVIFYVDKLVTSAPSCLIMSNYRLMFIKICMAFPSSKKEQVLRVKSHVK